MTHPQAELASVSPASRTCECVRWFSRVEEWSNGFHQGSEKNIPALHAMEGKRKHLWCKLVDEAVEGF